MTKRTKPRRRKYTADPVASRVDSADPFVCSREDIQALIDDAPDAYSQGFLAGVASFREQLAILTNRPY